MFYYKQRKPIMKHALITLLAVMLLPAVAAHGDEKTIRYLARARSLVVLF